jgi:hypothetical protein
LTSLHDFSARIGIFIGISPASAISLFHHFCAGAKHKEAGLPPKAVTSIPPENKANMDPSIPTTEIFNIPPDEVIELPRQVEQSSMDPFPVYPLVSAEAINCDFETYFKLAVGLLPRETIQSAVVTDEDGVQLTSPKKPRCVLHIDSLTSQDATEFWTSQRE